jgi:hypothetical protein
MVFLKITAADGTQTYVPDNSVVQLSLAADTLDAGSDYAAPQVIRGRLTGAIYYTGTGSATTVTEIPARVSGGIVYEYGTKTDDGTFLISMSN